MKKEYRVIAHGECLVEKSLIYYVDAESEEEAMDLVRAGDVPLEEYQDEGEGDIENIKVDYAEEA